MAAKLHYTTFEAFRPHFNALARVGYFKIVKKILPRSKYNVHRAFMGVTLFFILLYNLQHVIQVIKARHSTDLIVNTMLVLLTTVNALGKQLAFNLRSRRIDRLISVIDGPLFACTKPYHDQVMKANAVAMSRLLALYHSAIFICGSLWAVFPFVNRFYGNMDFTAYFPFKTDSSPLFELAVAYLSVLITMQAYGHVTMDCTIVSFYSQGKTQLQMLRHDLEHLVEPDDQIKIELDINSEKNKRFQFKDVGNRRFKLELQGRFVQCVEHYRQIVWFNEEIESIFGEAMILQFGAMAWVICMTLYKISILPLISAECFSMAVYLGCMLAQLFIYCYFGTCLKIESEAVNQSVYCGQWLQLSPSFRKQLLLLMERCSRPITPRSAYVVPLSLETYIAVLRLSYTLFTVLDRNNKI